MCQISQKVIEGLVLNYDESGIQEGRLRARGEGKGERERDRLLENNGGSMLTNPNES